MGQAMGAGMGCACDAQRDHLKIWKNLTEDIHHREHDGRTGGAYS
jgi:hypothetical protein